MPSRALSELLRGKGPHPDPIACVDDLAADLAVRQVAGFLHSIGQLGQRRPIAETLEAVLWQQTPLRQNEKLFKPHTLQNLCQLTPPRISY